MSAGILRLNENQPTSPVPSVDRLSVTFAMDASEEKPADPKLELKPGQNEARPKASENPGDALGIEVTELLGESCEEYAESLMEIHRSKSRGSISIPHDNLLLRRRSSGSVRPARKQSSASSVIFRGHSSSGSFETLKILKSNLIPQLVCLANLKLTLRASKRILSFSVVKRANCLSIDCA